jgi:hypothetical protein
LTWKRAHQIAWVITMLAGGCVGMILGWFASPFSHMWRADAGTMFLAWLHYPMTYWPWVLGGAIIGGLTYYAGDLITGAR